MALDLSDEERGFLKAQLRKHKAERSLSDRCRIVLEFADGLTSKEIVAEFGHSEHTVGKWRRRFAEHRIEGLSDAQRSGRPRTISDAQVAEVVKHTLETTPKDATHWSIRSMNQIERWFAELTRKQIQRGVHQTVAQLEAEIMDFIKAHNENPKPYKRGQVS